MKNTCCVLILLIVTFYSCKKDKETDIAEPQAGNLTPNQEQWGFVINYTASWCGPCGDWGSSFIHDLYETGNVVAVTSHASGDPMYNSDLYNSFSADRPTGGTIPAFWVGDIKTTDQSTMNTLLEQIPIAGIGLNYNQSGTTMNVKTSTEFFESGNGEYYLSVLVLEDGIDGSSSAGQYEQNGAASPSSYEHDFVLRASSVNNNSYGELIIQNPEKGSIVDMEYEITIDVAWNQDVYAVAVLWKLDLNSNPVYSFVNAKK